MEFLQYKVNKVTKLKAKKSSMNLGTFCWWMKGITCENRWSQKRPWIIPTLTMDKIIIQTVCKQVKRYISGATWGA